MLAWMSYVIVVSLLLSLAGLALEHSARMRQKPTRWLWGTSMTASLLVPLIFSWVSVRIPQLGGVADPAIPRRIIAVRDLTVSELSPSGWLAATAGSLSASPDLDRLLQVGLERRVGDPVSGNRGQQRAAEPAPTSLEARQHG